MRIRQTIFVIGRVAFVTRAATMGLFLLLGLSLQAVAQSRIVALGDSNTYGMNMSREQSYPAQLQALLRARGRNVEVVNQGAPGETSAGGLSRVDFAVPAGTRVAVVLYGVNDARQGVPVATFENNMSEILSRLRARGVRTVLCFRPHPLLRGEYQAAYRRVGQRHRAVPCNFRQGVPASGYAADGHENAEGNTHVARNVLRIIESMLR